MIRRVTCIICAVLIALTIVSGISCFDPDKERPKPKPPVPTYQDLTQKDHVLVNLQLAYNQRNYDRYAELLDDPNFIYYFSDEDFASGKTPEQWGRDEDLECHENMFDPNNQVHKILSLTLYLQYPAGQWIATTPDQGRFPGETWYYKSVSYNLTVVVNAQPENITYLAQNLKALFTIRQVDRGGKKIWQIVEWRDDVQI